MADKEEKKVEIKQDKIDKTFPKKITIENESKTVYI